MRRRRTPISICEIERVRRIEAMDELKRVIDVADDLPYSGYILHMGRPRENRRSAQTRRCVQLLDI